MLTLEPPRASRSELGSRAVVCNQIRRREVIPDWLKSA
jgi:hypothetical protein